VLAHHREQVAQQLALVPRQPLCDLVDRGRLSVRDLVGADPCVPATIGDQVAALGVL
jgi:hypothetical protein